MTRNVHCMMPQCQTTNGCVCGLAYAPIGAAVPISTPTITIDEIEARVRPTIGPTHSSRGTTVEGRISQEDFEVLIRIARAARLAS